MNRVTAFLRSHRIELLAGLVAFVVFASFSAGMLLKQSGAPHFVHQADAFLHGQLAIRGEPPNHNDWVQRNGRWYVSFPPFPAVLMMPFVALNGVRFNDVFFTVCFAAFNVGLFVALLRFLRARGEHDRSDRELLLFAAFWAFGSVYFYTAIRGEVWFTAHVVGVGLTLLYLFASLGARHPLLAGLAFGCAAITRANLVYAFPFFALEALCPDGRLPPLREVPDRIRAAFPKLLVFGLAGAFVLGLAFWMNHARFGSFTEFGHGILFNNRVNDRVRTWGLFNPHYFPDNFRSAFLLLPTLSTKPLRLGFDGNGMSMFLTTPLLLLLPFVRRARLTLALAVTAACIAVPGLFYMNNGWFQFGFRFSNDYLPYLFLLLVVGGVAVNRRFLALGIAGVVVSTWGAVVFSRF